MSRQSEVVRALRAQLAATEKVLEEQKWLIESVKRSPSWRVTLPIRWAGRQFRKLLKEFGRARASARVSELESTSELDALESDIRSQSSAVLTTLYQIALENFLQSGANLELPQSAEPEVSIVLILGSDADLTLACLRSIAEIPTEPIQIVIVDNASSDETPQLLQRVRGARVLVNGSSVSPFQAAKQAVQECRGSNLLFLSSAAQLQPGALQCALRTMRSSPDIGVVGGKIILTDGTLKEAGVILWPDGTCQDYGRGSDPFAPTVSFRRDVDCCSGAFFLTPRRIFEQFVSRDQGLSPASAWYNAYCARLWRDGLRVVYEPAAAVVHYGGPGARGQRIVRSLDDSTGDVARQEGLPTPGPEALLRARSRNAERRVLVIDDRVPHDWLGSGFPRAHAMYRALLRRGCFITLYPLSVMHEPWDEAYADFPREIEIMMGRDLLESFLRDRKGYYSMIIISRLHNMQWMASFLKDHPDWFKNATVIYDAEAIVAQREIGLRKLAGNPMTEKEVEALVRSEVEATALADCVIAVSDRERRVFQSYGIKRVEVLGHRLEPDPGNIPFESREGFLFVGAVHDDSSPNADSLVWFLSEIFPQIRKSLGDVPVTLAGLNRSKRIRELAKFPVRITGELPSLEDLYAKSRVFIAPTRFAAGIPLKVVEAASRGLPVIATTLLAEQLSWTDREAAIAGDAETFAAQCVEVYRDATKWARLREGALERIRNEYSPQTFERNVEAILESQHPARLAVR
jgi:glycosyltransferase involved in cell wall biosynthesis/GT2 family glycosyltransferase